MSLPTPNPGLLPVNSRVDSPRLSQTLVMTEGLESELSLLRNRCVDLANQQHHFTAASALKRFYADTISSSKSLLHLSSRQTLILIKAQPYISYHFPNSTYLDRHTSKRHYSPKRRSCYPGPNLSIFSHLGNLSIQHPFVFSHRPSEQLSSSFHRGSAWGLESGAGISGKRGGDVIAVEKDGS